MTIEIRRAADRYVTRQPGITTWHCFSAGAHYDAANLSFGEVIGVDEHTVEPGAGFDWHPHRGVTIATWVLEGALQHEDGSGGSRIIEPGELFVQDAAASIRHRETNASDSEALRFVQTTMTAPGDAHIVVERSTAELPPFTHGFVARGTWHVGDDALAEGDSLRVTSGVLAVGAGELLVVRRVES